MIYDEEDETSDQEEAQPSERRYAVGNNGRGNDEIEDEGRDDSASDFDDFEEGAVADDFGDFDDGIRKAAEAEKPGLSKQASQNPGCPFVSRAIVTSKVNLPYYRPTSAHGAKKQANLCLRVSPFLTSPISTP